MLNRYAISFNNALVRYTNNGNANQALTRPGYLFGWFSKFRHSFKLYPELEQFRKTLYSLKTDEEARNAIQQFMTKKNATFKNHSFRTYFLDELSQLDPDFEKFYPRKKNVVFHTGTLYRGMVIGKDVLESIFKNGHEDRRSSQKLEDYTSDTTGSIGISTSKNKQVAMSYARSIIVCPHTNKVYKKGGYLFQFNYRGYGGVDIIPTNQQRYNFFAAKLADRKEEVNIVGKIPAEDIVGAWTVNSEGELGNFISNPHYKEEAQEKIALSFGARLARLFGR